MPKRKEETYKDHYQRYKENHKKYYSRQEVKKKSKLRRRIDRQQLNDPYIKMVLKKNGSPITEEFIELKRQHIKLQRQINKKN